MSNASIEFENVSFQYPNREETVLKDISFEVSAGSKIGIVGKSGSGKSSLINLMLGLYSPTKGSVKINGQNVDSINAANYISVVPQEAKVFCGRSVKDNLMFEDGNVEEMYEIAKALNMHDLLMALPDGYETILTSENMLSGGQMQRFIFMRGLLKKAPIIIVDEGTANQDPENEGRIKNVLQHTDRTVILIAHQTSILKGVVDRVLVFKEGRIVEDGSIDTLNKKDGIYANLFHSQA